MGESPTLLTEADLTQIEIALKCAVGPLKYVVCDLSAIIAQFVENLIRAFHPPRIAKRANIVITELVNNVLENVFDPDSIVELEVKLNGTAMVIKITNATTPDRFERVRSHIDTINNAPSLRTLMRETIREHRKTRRKGGLGLIRLVIENKFQISTQYQDGFMTVESKLDLGGLA